MLRRNILIFHQAALGDFVLTWPLALALGRLFAQSRVAYVAPSQKGALAERALGIECRDIEGGWSALGGGGEPPPAVQNALAGAQMIITFMNRAQDEWTASVRKLAPGARLLHLEPTAPEGFAGHWTDWLLAQLEPDKPLHAGVEQMRRSIEARGVGWTGSAAAPKADDDDDEEAPRAPGAAKALRGAAQAGAGQGSAQGAAMASKAATALPARPVVIHPGSGGRAKRWAPEKFAQLAKQLRSAGEAVTIALGEVELEQFDARSIDQLAEAAPIARPADLLALHALLNSAAAYIGNDSGVSHLAGAMGLPTFCLVGPTDPVRWRPLGPRVRILRHEPLDALEADAVAQWLAKERGGMAR